jgi:hypothetical protein
LRQHAALVSSKLTRVTSGVNLLPLEVIMSRLPGERAPQVPNFFTTLLATLIAHGTNLGIAMMAHSVEEGITADMLQEMSQWCLREDTLKG